MGAPMANRLAAAGCDLTVYNRTPGKMQPLLDLGAKGAESLREFRECDIVFTMLSDDEALEAVVFGSEGLLEILQKDALHVSCSTISVSLSSKISKAHEEKSQGYASAPVFGRPEAAAAGKLFFVTAGRKEHMERLQPLFGILGQKAFEVSALPEKANLVKLSGNFLIATVIESLGEAMALIEKGGLDRNQYLDLITSTLFGIPLYRNYGAMIAERRFEPAGFAAHLGQKDIRLTLAAAEALDVPLPFASLLRDRFIELAAHGKGELDWSAIGSLAAGDAALPR